MVQREKDKQSDWAASDGKHDHQKLASQYIMND